jgi:hypothetical protein
VFEINSRKIAAALTIACLVHACSGCSRLSGSRADAQAAPAEREKAVAAAPKPALPPCRSAPIPMLQASAPGTRHHKVFLTWNASTSSGQPGAGTIGYCLYRSQKQGNAKKFPQCPDCEQVNLRPVLNARCVDDLVKDQTTYYYVAIAINSSNGISSTTNEAIAKIPVAGQQNAAPPDAASYPACRAPDSSNPPPGH